MDESAIRRRPAIRVTGTEASVFDLREEIAIGSGAIAQAPFPRSGAEGPGTSPGLVPGLRPASSRAGAEAAPSSAVRQGDAVPAEASPVLLPLTYSVPEAARLLGINRNTAYELAARGDLPTIRLGKRVLVVRAGLARLLDSAWESLK